SGDRRPRRRPAQDRRGDLRRLRDLRPGDRTRAARGRARHPDVHPARRRPLNNFSTDALGRFTEEREFKVDAPRTAAYAAAANDTNPRHTGGELAPPVFAIVPGWDAMTAAAGLVTPPAANEAVVHAAQDRR